MQNDARTPLTDSEQARFRHYQARVFVLTWFSYASYYLTRKPISVVKARLQEQLGMSTYTLGMLDTGYLAAYAVGQFINGSLGDRIGARRLLALGMVGTAACAFLFGASSAGWLLVSLWLLNGFFQSSGWPGNVKAMTPWFDKKHRGTIMGIWGTCYQAGGIVGTGLAAFLLVRWGWRSAFFTPSVWTASIGLIILFFLVEDPRKVGLEPADRASAPEGKPAPAAAERMTFLEAIRLPGILNLGGTYFCLKLIRYTLLMWLPFYLHKSLGYPEDTAGYLSTTFEIGGIAGAIVVGYLSDRYAAGRRVLFAAPMVLGIGVALAIYQLVAGWGMFFNGASMALVGFLLFGPDSLLSGAAAQDLGGTRGAASAAGIINGLGSVGAVLQGIMTSTVTETFGWHALFYALIGLSTLAAVILLPLLLRDLRRGAGLATATEKSTRG